MILDFLKYKNNKFDLHIHTTYSDGRNNVKEIVDLVEEAKINYFAITDHNDIRAHLELKKYNNYGYKGKIITGCELNVSLKDYYVELLAYDFNLNKFKKFKYLNKRYRNKQQKCIFKIVKQLAEDKGFVIDRHLKCKFGHGLIYYEIYQNILKHKENELLLKKWQIYNYKEFLRKHIYSPDGELYVFIKGAWPTASEVCDFVHSCGGKVVLAHPYNYELNAPEKLLNSVLSYDIDGIECVHFSHNSEQVKHLIEFADKHNLIKTGGSDFHGGYRTFKRGSVKNNIGFHQFTNKEINSNMFVLKNDKM